MKTELTITRVQLLEASARYFEAVRKLPPHLQEVCPSFKMFLVPDRYPYLHQSLYVRLSNAGLERYRMLLSPHVTTLLTIYAIQLRQSSMEVD